MWELNGKVVAVTGAGSGIGRMLGVTFAEHGCELALSDVDERGLAETARLVRERGVRTSAHVVDVADRARVQAWAAAVVGEHGGVDLAVNNAGAGMRGALESLRPEDLAWLMSVNFWGVVHGSQAFLPHLRRRPAGHLCNIASVFSLFTVPESGAYACSKFAVRAFTKTLAQELAGSTVQVSCVLPGGIRTNIARHTRFPKGISSEERERHAAHFEKWLAHTSAERAARVIVRGIRRGKRRILVGPDARVADVASRLAPGIWQRLMRFVS